MDKWIRWINKEVKAYGDVMKTVFTTGEAADICKVSQQTIIRCFDSGRLRGFRVPGSRFRRIPRDALVQFMKENGIPPDALDSGKFKILVVDDDPEIVELFVDVLERDGRFEVKTASTGYDAGILTQEFLPDLLILDYMLPDINGNVVCQTIRKNPNFEHMKIIIVSGVVNQDEINDLLKSGADDFVKKPFNIEKLIERVGELLAA
jgi:two-component system, OmpR family, response regulator